MTRRPDIELPDEAASYVEQHPDVIARLAEDARLDAKAAQYGITDAQREKFRGYIREKRAAAHSPQAKAEGRAFLARYGLA
ncbi:hypothetical protein [Paractinoplanes deccanensis]|nr:hypothetical protein [Actinoplanes deccanensis]